MKGQKIQKIQEKAHVSFLNQAPARCAWRSVTSSGSVAVKSPKDHIVCHGEAFQDPECPRAVGCAGANAQDSNAGKHFRSQARHGLSSAGNASSSLAWSSESPPLKEKGRLAKRAHTLRAWRVQRLSGDGEDYEDEKMRLYGEREG